jgi:hypothetical protein
MNSTPTSASVGTKNLLNRRPSSQSSSLLPRRSISASHSTTPSPSRPERQIQYPRPPSSSSTRSQQIYHRPSPNQSKPSIAPFTSSLLKGLNPPSKPNHPVFNSTSSNSYNIKRNCNDMFEGLLSSRNGSDRELRESLRRMRKLVLAEGVPDQDQVRVDFFPLNFWSYVYYIFISV